MAIFHPFHLVVSNDNIIITWSISYIFIAKYYIISDNCYCVFTIDSVKFLKRTAIFFIPIVYGRQKRPKRNITKALKNAALNFVIVAF